MRYNIKVISCEGGPILLEVIGEDGSEIQGHDNIKKVIKAGLGTVAAMEIFPQNKTRKDNTRIFAKIEGDPNAGHYETIDREAALVREETVTIHPGEGPMPDLVGSTKSWRGGIDSLVRILENCQKISSSRYGDATNNLLLAKSWLGNLLGEMGGVNPYPVANRPQDIPPTDQKTNPEMPWPIPVNLNQRLEAANWIRREIADVVDGVKHTYPLFDHSNPFIKLALNNALTYLANARFDMGFELEDIKKLS